MRPLTNLTNGNLKIVQDESKVGPDERHYRPGTEPATRSGEIDKAGFTSFLRNARAAMTDVNLHGAIHFVYKFGPTKHLNTFGLGETGD